jgi:hypothetical protein
MADELFKGINDKLGIDYKETPEQHAVTVIKEMKSEIKEMQNKKNDLVEFINKPLMLADQEFMRDQIKSLLLNCRTVLTTLERDLKIGSDSRMFESYSKVIDSTTKLITELRTLNLDVIKVSNETSAPDNNILNKKMKMSMADVMNMITKAAEENQTQKIDAKFEILDEEKLK